MSLPLLVALATIAHAGDPCPISVNIAEYTPEWRDRSADLAALQSKRAWLGLSYESRGKKVVVTAVSPGSPAAAAGIQRRDVILSINGAALGDVPSVNAAFDAIADDKPFAVTTARDDKPSTATITRAPADPLLLGMIAATGSMDCRKAHIGTLTPAQRTALAAGAFDAQHGFRCDDAHKALAPAFDSGDLVMIRGGSRVMLTAPGWATRCVSVAEHDGAQLNPASARALLESVIAAYVKDRHDNP